MKDLNIQVQLNGNEFVVDQINDTNVVCCNSNHCLTFSTFEFNDLIEDQIVLSMIGKGNVLKLNIIHLPAEFEFTFNGLTIKSGDTELKDNILSLGGSGSIRARKANTLAHNFTEVINQYNIQKYGSQKCNY